MRFKTAIAAIVTCIAAAGLATAGNNVPPTPFNVPNGAPRLNSVSAIPPTRLDTPSALRAPTPSDSSAYGFSTGNLWLDGTSQMWQAIRVNSGNANWQRYAVSRRVGDAGLPAAAALYGMCKLKAAYAGNAVQLTRASDSTTLDVGFGSNGCVDAPVGDSFCAGTTCTVTTWYDQSGNAYNATAPASNAPIWDGRIDVGGVRAVSFASNGYSLTGLTTVSRYLQIPSGLSFSLSSASFVAAGQTLQSKTNSIQRYFLANAASTAGWANSWNYGGISAAGVTTATCSTAVPGGSPTVWGVAASTSTANCYVGNRTSSLTYSSQGSSAGGYIGNTNTARPANMDLVAFALWTSTLSAANMGTAVATLERQFNIPPQSDEVLVVDGDSMSAGPGSTLDNSWPKMTVPLLKYTTTLYNVSISGLTLSGMYANFAANVATLYPGQGRNFVVLLLGGANDIRVLGSTAATVEALLVNYAQAVRALGSNTKFLVGTYPLQCDILGNSTQKAALQALNTWIQTNWSVPIANGGLGADGIVDFASDPTIGVGDYSTSPFCGNSTNSPDGQHPTDYLMGYYAPIAAAAINGLSR